MQISRALPYQPPTGRHSASGDVEHTLMNLFLWLPLLFALGLAGIGLCGLFLLGCERI
ncbi:hypothetical protein CS8_062430 [Cupriavidus sp. 8B]